MNDTPQIIGPSKDEIAKFIEMFERLCAFEISHRFTRGYGAFRPEEIPDAATMKVISWLNGIVIMSNPVSDPTKCECGAMSEDDCNDLPSLRHCGGSEPNRR